MSGGLEPHALAALVFAALVFGVFIWDRLPIATVSLAVLALLPLGFTLFPLVGPQGPVDPLRFMAGFASPALVAICGLMIVGHGLVVTGALEPVARRLATLVTRRPRGALLLVLVAAAAASGFVNDTPVVVLLIPLLLAAAAQSKVPASGWLMPMNFAVLLGGMATTIGTSTNLIVVGLAAELGVGPIAMLEFADLVALVAVPALLYLWLVVPRLLRGVPQPQGPLAEDLFEAEGLVPEGSRLAGAELREAFAAAPGGLPLVDLVRQGRRMMRLPTVRLRVGDRLLLRASAARLKALEEVLGLQLHGSAKPPADAGGSPLPGQVVAQLIVAATSPLEGRTVRQERLAERYGLIVVGLRPRPGTPRREGVDLADRVIAAGDVLLVEGTEDTLREAQRDGLGLLLDQRFTPPRRRQAPLALAVMAAVVLLAATRTLPIALAALLGAGALLLTRVLTWQDVTHSLSTKVVLLVASSLALGDALMVTGATPWLARQLAALSSGLAPAWVAALLMALMGLITNFVSNNAAAAIGTPLAVSLAQALGAPALPFVLAVLFGCNLCYLTPMGYQTNLLVMNAGGYRFGDFVKAGGPLFLIVWAGLSAALAWRYF